MINLYAMDINQMNHNLCRLEKNNLMILTISKMYETKIELIIMINPEENVAGHFERTLDQNCTVENNL